MRSDSAQMNSIFDALGTASLLLDESRRDHDPRFWKRRRPSANC